MAKGHYSLPDRRSGIILRIVAKRFLWLTATGTPAHGAHVQIGGNIKARTHG